MVLCKLKVVNIEGTNLTNDQVNEVLTGMANQDSQIQKLNISLTVDTCVSHQCRKHIWMCGVKH